MTIAKTFRPSLLSIYLFLILIGGIACNGPQPNPNPNPPITPEVLQKMQSELLDAHNKERAARGLIPFTENEKLVLAAENHVKFMAKAGRLAHFGIGDGTPSDRLNTVGYQALAGGENVAWGQVSVSQVMQDWMNSSGHRRAILGNYKEYGGAVAAARDGSLYWCSVFGTPGVNVVRGGQEIWTTIKDVETEPPTKIKSENGYLIDNYSEYDNGNAQE